MASSFIRDLLGIPDEPLSNAVFGYYALKEIDEFLPNERRDLETENLRLRNKAMRKEYGISEEDASLDRALLGGAAYGLEKARQGLPAPKSMLHFDGVDNIADLLLRKSHGPGIRTNLISNPFKSASKPAFISRLAKGIRTAV